jgi:hypothetical protein
MQNGYYQNILYPLQDRILRITEELPVDFYLTRGTALSRAYLNHRYSDDLDFFVNDRKDFRQQVEIVVKALKQRDLNIDVTVADEGFARVFIREGEAILKIDFVNDIPYRTGKPVKTDVFIRTDSIFNILSNKLTSLVRYSAKDVTDIVFIALKFDFNWVDIIKEASEKDMWVNAVEISGILDEFPVEKLDELIWVEPLTDKESFREKLGILIKDLLTGNKNTLCGQNL